MAMYIKHALAKQILPVLSLVLLLSFIQIRTFISEESIPDDASCPYAIQIDGADYIYRGGTERRELSDEDVDLVGVVIKKTVPIYTMPEKDGQANFGAAGSPYGVAPDGEYVFFFEDCWRPLISEEEYNRLTKD